MPVLLYTFLRLIAFLVGNFQRTWTDWLLIHRCLEIRLFMWNIHKLICKPLVKRSFYFSIHKLIDPLLGVFFSPPTCSLVVVQGEDIIAGNIRLVTSLRLTSCPNPNPLRNIKNLIHLLPAGRADCLWARETVTLFVPSDRSCHTVCLFDVARAQCCCRKCGWDTLTLCESAWVTWKVLACQEKDTRNEFSIKKRKSWPCVYICMHTEL